MDQDYDRHLAAAVLNDGRMMSYRLLSRELKVHVNIAKRMLYDFHRTQNAKKPGSVHATYLLDGIPKPFANEVKTNGYHTHDEDVPMQSSPFTSSAAQQEDEAVEVALPVKSIILAREEDLQAAKENFDFLQSIHIHSLQQSTLHNLQSLSDCNRRISSTFNSEDPLVAGRQYGVIQNSKVRRRTSRRPLGGAPSIAAATDIEKVKSRPTTKVFDIGKTESKPTSRSSQESVTNAEVKPVTGPSTKGSNKMPALKKEQSDIFKSFSKPKSTLKKETTDSSTVEPSAPASQESVELGMDQEMKDTSDGEQEEGRFVPENRADPEARNVRSQRAEQLRKMMDEDDEEMDDTPEKEEALEDGQDATGVVEDSTATTTQQKESTPEPALQAESGGGRRRGRRKVMKKKTTKDEEGYLVTREEPAWESFSEDEPGPPKERAPTSAAAGSKTKKVGGTRPGQGNIMSFFGKK